MASSSQETRRLRIRLPRLTKLQLVTFHAHDLSLEDIPRPVIKNDEVLVRVRAASMHADIWHVVSGRPFIVRMMGAGFLSPRNPVPGTDISGTIESVGTEVARFRPGDDVFGEIVRGHQWKNGGAFAEYAAVPANALALKPPNVDFAQAADDAARTRVVVDQVASLTDESALGWHARLVRR